MKRSNRASTNAASQLLTLKTGSLVAVACMYGTLWGCKSKSETGERHRFVIEYPEGKTGQEGAVTYSVGNSVYRITAKAGAKAVNLSALYPGRGEEETPAVSKSGEYMTWTSDRFEPCKSWSCVFLVSDDFKTVESVLDDGEPLRAAGRVAVDDSGKTFVFASQDGPHETDLWVINRSPKGWGKKSLLTGNSKYKFHRLPVLSADGSQVVFDCTNDAYSQEDSNICKVGTGSNSESGPTILVSAKTKKNSAHHGDFFGEDEYVFEGDWDGEQIWLTQGAETKALSATHQNNNSPCALPNGGIASLWLGRPGGDGIHELTMFSKDEWKATVLTPGVDISDTGMSCHR